jgi:hypothetical protein
MFMLTNVDDVATLHLVCSFCCMVAVTLFRPIGPPSPGLLQDLGVGSLYSSTATAGPPQPQCTLPHSSDGGGTKLTQACSKTLPQDTNISPCVHPS